MTEDEDFATALRSVLHDRKIRSADLSERMDVSRSYVSMLSTGKKVPGAETVEKISDLVGSSNTERSRLHRAAARSHGFKLDLPPDW